MIFIYLALFCFFCILNKYLYKTIYRINTLFNLIWVMSGALSTLGFYGIYKPSIQIHFLVIVTIFIFNIVYYLMSTKKTNKESPLVVQSYFNYKLLYFLNFFSWLFMIRFLLKSIPILMDGGFRLLRLYAYNSDYGLASTEELMIAQIIVEAIYLLSVIFVAYDMNSNRSHKPLWFITLTSMVVYILSFAGRGIILNFFIYFGIFFVLFNKGNLFKNIIIYIRKNKFIVLIVTLLIISILIISESRSWIETTAFRQFYTYFVGPLAFLDKIMIEIDSTNFQYTYGKAIMGFIANMFEIMKTLLFKSQYAGSDFLISSFTSIPRYIAPDTKFNAMTTMIFPFYKDFGIFGVVLGTSILSFSIALFEKRVRKSNTKYIDLFIFAVLINILINSNKNYYLYMPMYGTLLFLLVISSLKLKSGV